jgi:hypothetical protein
VTVDEPIKPRDSYEFPGVRPPRQPGIKHDDGKPDTTLIPAEVLAFYEQTIESDDLETVSTLYHLAMWQGTADPKQLVCALFCLDDGGLWPRVTHVLELGVAKYGRDNWRGLLCAQTRYYAAGLRHLFRISSPGETLSEQEHDDHAACSIVFLLWFALRGTS